MTIATLTPDVTSADWPVVPGRMPLTEAAVTEIAAIADVAARNLWITQSYADLGRRLLAVLGTDQTWCTFAIWASNTAGLSIRGEELPRRLGELFLGPDPDADAIDPGEDTGSDGAKRWHRGSGILRDVRRSHIEHLVAEAVSQVSAHIAAGNTLVYGELAPLFVRFVELLEGPGLTGFDPIEETLDRLRIPSTQEAPLVRVAFRQYALAVVAKDATTRAQHVLAANVAAVLHEQKRLQDDVASALDVGLIDFGDDLDGDDLDGDDLDGAVHGPLLGAALRPPTTEFRQHVASHLESLWSDALTEIMMTMIVPGETLHLGRDVPLPPGGGSLYSPALRQLALPRLCELMAEWDRSDCGAGGSGARDWADLRDRMGYIVVLFRSRQQCLELTTPPFTPDQIAWMTQDRLPPSFGQQDVHG